VETDEQGRFTCAGIELGRVAVRVRPPTGELTPWSGHAEILADEPAWLEVRLGPGATVEGRITDPSGAPVEGVGVRGWGDDPRLHVLAMTDADGRYMLERVVPGRVELRANRERARGLGSAERRLELDHGARIEWNAVLPGAPVIAGRLVDEGGAALERWQVRAYPGEDRTGSPPSARTGPDGRFRLEGLRQEPYFVEARAPDAGWYDPPRAWRDIVRPGGPELELVAETGPPARVVGRVVDGRGEALGGAQVWATMTGTGRYVTAEADPGGAFAVEGLPAGRYTLTVSSTLAPNHALGERELAAGETLDLGAVELPDPARLVVHVRGLLGEPVEGASVELRTEEGYESRVPIAFEAPGTARSGPAPPGRYALVVRAPGRATTRRVVELVAGETHELELELRPGVECRFELVVTAGENPPGIAARLLGEGGALALRCFAPDPERSGRIELTECLAPGRYRMLAERVNPTLSGELAFEVPPGSGPLRFTVPLAP
jgi:hypothetical protein